WRHDIGGGYSVRGAYDLLTTLDVVDADATSDLIWHKQVPLKVSVLAWRILRNMLPTRDNLVARNIISHDARFCVTGCGEPETASHLFLSCPAFAPLWSLVRSWIGIFSVEPESLHDHFVQFIPVLVVCELVAHFYSLFGCVVSRSYGMSGITGFLRQRKLRFTKC
ncbi:70 kDa peptidyl-prolyl isomerase, partial [Trifolium medium]|nr:70 kDa peptidyl-prolyl isomerase [Trifolium medium]